MQMKLTRRNDFILASSTGVRSLVGAAPPSGAGPVGIAVRSLCQLRNFTQGIITA